MRRALAIASVLLATAAAATAHPTGKHTGFVATVSGIEPPQLGLLVEVQGGHERLALRNLTQKTVVLFDERGLPALRLAPGEAGTTADARIGSTGPPPEDGEFVKDWRIPGEADGQPFEIVGFLGYRPPSGERADDGLPVWAVVLAGAGGAVVLAAALALPLLRRKGESERDEAATER